MSFNFLPPELQIEIVIELPKETLASLCLVSNSTLELARPLLYRSIRLNMYKRRAIYSDESASDDEGIASSEGAREELGNFFPTRDPRRLRLEEVLWAHQVHCSYVKELQLDLGFAHGSAGAKYTALLPHFSTLQVLILDIAGEGPMTPDDEPYRSLLKDCPRSLVSLGLVMYESFPTFVYRLLQKVPLLEDLYIEVPGNEAIVNESHLAGTSCPLELHRLRSLQLGQCFQSQSLFAEISKASRVLRLTRLRVDFLSVRALVPAHLSQIRHLTVMDSFNSTYDGHARVQLNLAQHLSEFMSVIDACTSLEIFELAVVEPATVGGIEQLQARRILHHLPPSLRTLTLGDTQFSPSYLLDFLSAPNTALLWLKILRFSPGFDNITQEKLEDVCARRNIVLELNSRVGWA